MSLNTAQRLSRKWMKREFTTRLGDVVPVMGRPVSVQELYQGRHSVPMLKLIQGPTRVPDLPKSLRDLPEGPEKEWQVKEWASLWAEEWTESKTEDIDGTAWSDLVRDVLVVGLGCPRAFPDAESRDAFYASGELCASGEVECGIVTTDLGDLQEPIASWILHHSRLSARRVAALSFRPGERSGKSAQGDGEAVEVQSG